MNFVWTGVMLVGISMLLLKNVDMIMSTLLLGSSKAISLSLKLWGIYALWLGILRIVEDTGLDKKLGKLLSPLIKKLFGKTNDYTESQIAINITSNLFGMGNACTPSGINAIGGLDKGSKYATSAMILIIILNSTSMQLVPTTIIGLRSLAGSMFATDIIIPTFIATFFSTLFGILLVKLFSKIFKDKQ